MQTERYRTELVYDPHETYEQFCARRQAALEQGRQAVRERRISGDLYLFYEYLIERVGGNTYTWVSEETMTEVFGVDASTIKRWIAKLVRAGLIRRQRQFATTSRTYITAYDPPTILLDGETDDTTDAAAAPLMTDPEPALADPIPTQEASGNDAEAVSFQRTNAPTFGADLRRDLKDSHLNHGGGGKIHVSQNQGLAPEIQLLLNREGVSHFYVAPQLQQLPLAELRAVSGYLDRQHNVHDRARLFAALTLQGFGARLLAGRAPQPRPGRQGHQAAPKAQPRGDNHLKYISGTLAPYIQGSRPPTESAAPPPDPSPLQEPAAITPPALHAWQQALTLLRQGLPTHEFHTWFAEARLLQLEDGEAVIGTPNIFAREKLTTCYQAQIAQALTASYGRSVQVQIVLGG